MDEINQLWADLKVLERYSKDHIDTREAEKNVRLQIARLEAAKTDPWRHVKADIEHAVKHLDMRHIGEYVDHLTAENDRLAKRVAKLEAALKRITTVPDCGCVPCRGQCESTENLRVNAEEIREIARAHLEDANRIAKGGDSVQ